MNMLDESLAKVGGWKILTAWLFIYHSFTEPKVQVCKIQISSFESQVLLEQKSRTLNVFSFVCKTCIEHGVSASPLKHRIITKLQLQILDSRSYCLFLIVDSPSSSSRYFKRLAFSTSWMFTDVGFTGLDQFAQVVRIWKTSSTKLESNFSWERKHWLIRCYFQTGQVVFSKYFVVFTGVWFF